LQKRLMHHKQQLEDLEAAKKAFHASTQVWQPVRSVYLYSVCMEKAAVAFCDLVVLNHFQSSIDYMYK
jgi:hypothetical protein